MFRWYPQTGLSSKFATTSELSIPEEYQKFLDKFEHVVLVAFGTTFSPKFEHLMNIVEAAKLADPKTTGFIFSVKESNAAYQAIQD